MDTVWVDTMFPGIDPDEGWEKNLERVVNYDYLLKEYLDWQLKHLTTDNFDQVDWSKVEADIISMAAKSVDLTAYYTKDEADNKSQLTLQAAEDYTTAQLASYYTASEVEGAISTQAGLTLTAAEGYTDTKLLSYYTANQVDGAISAQATLSQQAAEGYVNTTLQSYYTASQVDGAISTQATLSQQAAENYTNTQLQSYYTKTEIGDFTGYSTAVAALQAYADSAVASIDLTAYYTASEVDSAISSSEATVKGYADGKIAGLSLAAVSSGGSAQLVLQSGGSTISGSGAALSLSVSGALTGSNSTISLSSGGITLASGNIKLDGTVVFANDNISRLNNNSGYQTSSGVTTIIGNTVTTSYVNALNITADSIKANSVIAGPLIYGGIFYATQGSNSDYFRVTSSGWELYTSSTERASLKQSSDALTLSLGNSTPGKVVKYYGVVSALSTSNNHYLWIGGTAYPWNTSTCVGLLLNLSNQKYKIYGTAV